MFSRSTWLHLRIPFSYFLLPVFLFALAVSSNLDLPHLAWSFFIVHFLLYPASNGYNSYFDKDEKSIGGLKNPPPVNKGLYYTAIMLDGIAVVLGYLTVNLTFSILLLVYGLVSKMYSHPAVRLKKYPFAGWLTAGLFQGFFSFIMCYIGINNFNLDTALSTKILAGGFLTSVMLWGNYPMTQVYQHEEDTKHNDRTLSIVLGIAGTFIFVQGVFFIAAIGFVLYFRTYFSIFQGYVFLVALMPVVIFFMLWFYRVMKDRSKADFSNAMWLNFISGTCLNGFFIYLFFTSHTFH